MMKKNPPNAKTHAMMAVREQVAGSPTASRLGVIQGRWSPQHGRHSSPLE